MFRDKFSEHSPLRPRYNPNSSDSFVRNEIKTAKEPRSQQVPSPMKEEDPTLRASKKSVKRTSKKARFDSSIEMEGKKAVERTKSTASKRKRSSVANMNSTTSSLISSKQIQDNQKLQQKINNLHKSISSQEKILKDLKKKINVERTELDDLQVKVNAKTKAEKAQDEEKKTTQVHTSNISMSEDLKTSPYRKRSLPRPKTSDKVSFLDRDFIHNTSEILVSEPFKNEKSFQEYTSVRNSHAVDSPNQTAIVLERELTRKTEESLKNQKKVNELKSYIGDITRRHEEEIHELKQQIQTINEENFKMKYKNNSTKEFEKIENMQNRKIQELQEALAQKDQEMVQKEGYYKGQIEEINAKLLNLQLELKKTDEYEEKIRDLNQQLQLKSNEVHMTKKYYLDKLQVKIDDQVKQKKEWSKVYNELLGEIRTLKGEIDLLGYENRKLILGSDKKRNSRDEEVFSNRKFTDY